MSEFAHPLWEYRHWVVSVFFFTLIVEAFFSWFRWQKYYTPSYIFLHSFMSMIEQGLRMVTFALRLIIFTYIASYVSWSWELSIISMPILFIACDFIYYWKHRFWHSTSVGWVLHSPHHSATEMNIFISVRLGWVQRLLDDFFYLPLLLFGFHPLAVFMLLEINHAFQFWCHTDLIARLPWLEPWLNTPSNHRVHHSKDREMCDSNFGSALMIWDKLFGTYKKETSKIEYGIEDTYEGLNPLKIQFGPMVDLFSKSSKHKKSKKRESSMDA